MKCFDKHVLDSNNVSLTFWTNPVTGAVEEVYNTVAKSFEAVTSFVGETVGESLVYIQAASREWLMTFLKSLDKNTNSR